MRRYLPFLTLVSLGIVTGIACGATPSQKFGASSGGSPAGSSGAVAGGSSSSMTGLGGGVTIDAGQGSGGGLGCSGDLQNVTDGMGNVVQMCPPNQGCSGGTCIDACQAASDSKGSIGCDFWAPDTPFYRNGQPSTYGGACYAVFVANTWSRSAQITVTRGGQSFNLSEFGYVPSGVIPNLTYTPIPAAGVPPNQVAVLFLSHDPNAMTAGSTPNTPLTCPKPPAYLHDAAASGSVPGTAFHVVSDTPITAYDIIPYGGALSYLPSASLLYPSTAWGTNYYVVGPHSGDGVLWMLLVGAVDGTMVTASAAQTLVGASTEPTLGAGTTTTFTLNQGQTLQWTDFLGLGADPSGTVLSSTQPIGVFTGNTYLLVPSATSPSGGGHDAAHQQIPHIKALGHEYVAPGISTRMASLKPESVPYRVLGVVDGTALTYDPAAPASAPKQLNAGDIVEFETTALFVVKSQDAIHPFSITQYMPGAGVTGGSMAGSCSDQPMFGQTCALGDEDWITLLPPAQFLQRYVFFTDPTYATTNLVITRVKGPSGFSDVTVECLGAPVTGWMNVDTAGTYQVAHVDLVRGTKPVANCNGSNNQATSAGKFGINVWGTDWFASYGYPAGGNIGSINQVTVTPK
jgi:hypothetical protein